MTKASICYLMLRKCLVQQQFSLCILHFPLCTVARVESGAVGVSHFGHKPKGNFQLLGLHRVECRQPVGTQSGILQLPSPVPVEFCIFLLIIQFVQQNGGTKVNKTVRDSDPFSSHWAILPSCSTNLRELQAVGRLQRLSVLSVPNPPQSSWGTLLCISLWIALTYCAIIRPGNTWFAPQFFIVCYIMGPPSKMEI